MELLQLKYFQTVARLEHMTNAAKKLHIAQPALSMTIARLEEDLGVPLFDRTRRQIRLNTYGKAFLRKVDAALSLLDEGQREVRDLAGLERGTVAIATNALNRITQVIRAFRDRFPNVTFRIIEVAPAETNRIADMLEDGTVDIGFSPTLFHRIGIQEHPVLQAEVLLAVPNEHRFAHKRSISLQQVAQDSFIEYKEGHPFREVNDHLCQIARIERKIMCEVEDPTALGNLVHAGLGVALVPKCKGEKSSDFTLLHIEDSDCKRNFSISWYESRYQSKATSEFKTFVADYFARI